MSDSLQKEYTLKATFSQNSDCVGGKDDYQFLRIKVADGGGGPFFIMETKRWSFDSPDDLYKLLKEFEEKLKLIQ
ncbi:MAG TPA: hypothetical protein VMX17_06655 [Candidatus Glassbacteria bacterium]|nr:hypothetical protein [Candidatus Glassbacteria bacterium]